MSRQGVGASWARCAAPWRTCTPEGSCTGTSLPRRPFCEAARLHLLLATRTLRLHEIALGASAAALRSAVKQAMPPLATPAHGRGAEEEPRPDRPGCAAWCQEWICDYEECAQCGSEVGCGPLEGKDLPDAVDEQSTGVVGWHSPPPSPPCSYSGNNCISTGCCHDPAHFACMKARNKPMTAQCRTIPGEGCEDTDDWICPGWKLSDAEWAAMTGKEPALRRSPPPPMPPHLTCAVGDGSCFESRCCADTRAGCYRKRHKYFAQCLPRVANCADNTEWLCPKGEHLSSQMLPKS